MLSTGECYIVGCSTDRPIIVPNQNQLNIRLKPDRDVFLRAAAFVNGLSAGELARQLLEEAIQERYAEVPTVKKAVEARIEQTAANEGKLAHLPKPSPSAAHSRKTPPPHSPAS
jgi:hypothetical protein